MFWSPARLRDWFEDGDPASGLDRLIGFLGPAETEPAEQAAAFWRQVGINLRDGHVRLVFVADDIAPSLQRLVEFLNEQMPRVEVLAVEIRQYRPPGSTAGAVVARLVGQTARSRDAKQPPLTPPRRAQPWTITDLLDLVGQDDGEEATTARVIADWATAHPHIRIDGGKGPAYPAVIMSADTGRPASRWPGVLCLYATTTGQRPILELRVSQMCTVPPYDEPDAQARLTSALHELGIPRLDSEAALVGKSPGIPLIEPTNGRARQLLSLIGKGIQQVRIHATEPDKPIVA